jgi:hypothetical protein
MHTKRLIVLIAIFVSTLVGSAHAAVTVFQNPSNNPTPAPPATVVAGGSPVTLHLFYQTGTNPSPGCPGVPPTCNRCLSGTGDEVCGWDIHIGATDPSITLQSFTPDTAPGSDIVWAISGNVLRMNGGDPIVGELGIHRLGSLVVSAAPAASGNVTVVGNLHASTALVALPIVTGTTIAAVGTAVDSDLDGVPDSTDNCPTVANADQADGNGGLEIPPDGVGNACDNCLDVNNPRVAADFLTTNPWATLSGGQRDDDHDGYGNKCDADFTATGALVGGSDLAQYRPSNNKSRALDVCGTVANQPCARYDLNEAGALTSGDDLAIFRALNNQARGPRCATHCTGLTTGPLPCEAGTAGSCAFVFSP